MGLQKLDEALFTGADGDVLPEIPSAKGVYRDGKECFDRRVEQ